MDVRWIAPSGIETREWTDVPALLERHDGFVWVDVRSCDRQKAKALADRFGFHKLAVRDILERSHLPKIHAYPDHMFVVLHAPEPGDAGHTEFIQVGMFIGRSYLVTTHGPPTPELPADLGFTETEQIVERLDSERRRFVASWVTRCASSRRCSSCDTSSYRSARWPPNPVMSSPECLH